MDSLPEDIVDIILQKLTLNDLQTFMMTNLTYYYKIRKMHIWSEIRINTQIKKRGEDYLSVIKKICRMCYRSTKYKKNLFCLECLNKYQSGYTYAQELYRLNSKNISDMNKFQLRVHEKLLNQTMAKFESLFPYSSKEARKILTSFAFLVA